MWKCNCGESNSDNSSICQSCGNRKIIAQTKSSAVLDRQRQERIKQQMQQQQEYLQQQKERMIANGQDGYYQYKVISLNDNNNGGIYTNTLENELNQLGLEGWHLKCAYTNELGRNSSSNGVGGFSTGTNSTIDQNILIFERFIKFN